MCFFNTLPPVYDCAGMRNFSFFFLMHRSSRKNLSSSPQGDATFPLRTKSQPVTVSTPTGTGSPISSPSQAKKQLAYARTKPSPPTVLAKPAKPSTAKQEGREGRSHASSATKPRKHRSNQQRSKEAPANLTPKIWRSAPRMVSLVHFACCQGP